MSVRIGERNARIPNISIESLKSLDDAHRDAYLSAAIDQAQANTNNFGIPFMIMKDGRSCVMVTDEHSVGFIGNPQDFKAAILSEANGGDQPQVRTVEIEQVEMDTDAEEYANESLTRSFSIDEAGFRVRIDPSSSVLRLVRKPSTVQTPPSPGNLQKAHRTLGLIGDVSPTLAPEISPKAELPQILAKIENRSEVYEKSFFEKTISSPSKLRKRPAFLRRRSTSTATLSPASFRSPVFYDELREQPESTDVNWNNKENIRSEEIGCALSTPEDFAFAKSIHLAREDQISVNSSTYFGDEGSIERGTMLQIVDLSDGTETASAMEESGQKEAIGIDYLPNDTYQGEGAVSTSFNQSDAESAELISPAQDAEELAAHCYASDTTDESIHIALEEGTDHDAESTQNGDVSYFDSGSTYGNASEEDPGARSSLLARALSPTERINRIHDRFRVAHETALMSNAATHEELERAQKISRYHQGMKEAMDPAFQSIAKENGIPKRHASLKKVLPPPPKAHTQEKSHVKAMLDAVGFEIKRKYEQIVSKA